MNEPNWLDKYPNLRAWLQQGDEDLDEARAEAPVPVLPTRRQGAHVDLPVDTCPRRLIHRQGCLGCGRADDLHELDFGLDLNILTVEVSEEEAAEAWASMAFPHDVGCLAGVHEICWACLRELLQSGELVLNEEDHGAR